MCPRVSYHHCKKILDKCTANQESEPVPPESDQAVITVSDSGVGIGSSHLERIFERFYRVDKTGNRKQGGSGLGLAIVKHIIEAHQEKLVVESTLGVGSEFSFTLQRITMNNNKIDH